MKKVLALILAAAMAFGLVACGGGGDSSSTPAAGSGNAASTASTAGSGEKDGTLLYYCAFIGDFGLGDMGNRASLAAAEKYNLEYKLVEYGTDSSVAVNSLRDALETSNLRLCRGLQLVHLRRHERHRPHVPGYHLYPVRHLPDRRL